jgi:hypothetical protein
MVGSSAGQSVEPSIGQIAGSSMSPAVGLLIGQFADSSIGQIAGSSMSPVAGLSIGQFVDPVMGTLADPSIGLFAGQSSLDSIADPSLGQAAGAEPDFPVGRVAGHYRYAQREGFQTLKTFRMRTERRVPGSNAILIQKSDFYQAICDSFPDLFSD